MKAKINYFATQGLDHDNVLKFKGACLNHPQCKSYNFNLLITFDKNKYVNFKEKSHIYIYLYPFELSYPCIKITPSTLLTVGAYVLLEYCEEGALLGWLKKQRGKVNEYLLDKMCSIVFGVAKGMEYLVSKEVSVQYSVCCHQGFGVHSI